MTMVYLDLPNLNFDAAGVELVMLHEHALREFLADLSDELNSALDAYTVRLVHLDGDDYLEFLPAPVVAEE